MNIESLYSAAQDPSIPNPVNHLYAALTPTQRAQQRFDNGTLPGDREGRGGGGSGSVANAEAIARASAAHPIDTGGQTLQQYFGNLALLNQDTTGNWANPYIAAIVGGALGVGAAGVAAGAGAGAVGGGAAGGAAGGASSAAFTGQNVGKGALMGALGGAVGAAAAPASSALSNSTGMNPSLASGIVKTGANALTGAVGGAISGQGAGAGALSGAEHGALGAGTGAVIGSVFNSGNTIPTSGSTDIPYNSGNTSMSVDPSYWDTTNGGLYGPDLSGSTNVSAGTPSWNGDITYTDPMSGIGGDTAPTGGLLPTDQYGNVLSGGGAPGASGGGANWAGLLSRLLGGGGSSGGAGGNLGGLLQRLFGYGSSLGGGILQHNAAVGAANNYANQSKFSPFNVSGAEGSTTFGPNGINSTLSPAEAAQRAALGGVTNSAASYLQKGNTADVNNIFNDLQSMQRDSNNRNFQSNLDSQFGNGILASSAGQYQSQAALDAINKMTTQNHITAQNLGSTIQQDQLRQLTAGLNGQNQMDQLQLDQGKLGLQGGADQSFANSQAYKPSLSANTTTPWGDLLSNMGGNAINSGNNDQLSFLLRQLLQGGG